MDRKDILLGVAILGFFGINGLDVINAVSEFVNGLYLKLGNLLWAIIIVLIWLYQNRKK